MKEVIKAKTMSKRSGWSGRASRSVIFEISRTSQKSKVSEISRKSEMVRRI